jgi:hypothetical protein
VEARTLTMYKRKYEKDRRRKFVSEKEEIQRR